MSYQTNPQTYVYGVSSPFKKRYLLPFWVIRVATMLGNFIVYAFALGFIGQNRSEIDRVSDEFNTLLDVDGIIAVIAVSFVLITLTLGIDVVTIVQRCRRTLTPKFFVIANSAQTAAWVVLLVLSLFGANTGSMIVLGAITLGAFIALLGYSAIIFSRERRGKIVMLKAGSLPPQHHNNNSPPSEINYSGAPAAAGPSAYQSYPNPPVYTANPAFANVNSDRKDSIESDQTREPEPPRYN
ncbi:hypothetical protein SODALDRAFT_320625 [Sodiomyces alkalinus F11]|uniref:Uncharacterized protein n=1 Tax=Sodiomyces alkalinus (strain CBS 110278 / VKM F-3762 / F11) TaxID=1314773 RepID=A0A3N2PLG5_SODAK|nr:hypothetical protein SODALDRAFT_320625 [Sodiomyces alkalinus F11]ROT35244.1 hypothetical protein SODALDRAFT_320625 [Sodiomyces alkalinus F11]